MRFLPWRVAAPIAWRPYGMTVSRSVLGEDRPVRPILFALG